MYAQIHFQGYGGSLCIGDRNEDAFSLVVMMIEFNDISVKLYGQAVDAVEFIHKSANRIIGYGISDEIQVEILSSTPRIAGNAPHDNAALYRGTLRHTAVSYGF